MCHLPWAMCDQYWRGGGGYGCGCDRCRQLVWDRRPKNMELSKCRLCWHAISSPAHLRGRRARGFWPMGHPKRCVDVRTPPISPSPSSSHHGGQGPHAARDVSCSSTLAGLAVGKLII